MKNTESQKDPEGAQLHMADLHSLKRCLNYGSQASGIYLFLVLSLVFLTGCNHDKGPRANFTMVKALAVINENNLAISAHPWRLSGAGRYGGEFVDSDGKRQAISNKKFKLSAVYPNHLSFKAGHLPETNTLFEVGSNETECWVWEQYLKEDVLRISARATLNNSSGQLLIQPDTFIEALGIQLLNPDTSGPSGPRYRVVADYHQMIFEETMSNGQAVIHKEYWVSRYKPHLIERVQYRDAEGRVIMEAQLSDYQPLDNNPVLVAREIQLDWPERGWKLNLAFERLKLYENIDHQSFIQPEERARLNPRLAPPSKIIWLEELPSGTSVPMS